MSWSPWPLPNCEQNRDSVHMLRGDLDDDAGLVRAKALESASGIEARQLVDVSLGALSDQLGAAADGEHVSVGMGGVEDHDRDAVVALQVAGFHAREGGVEVDVLAIALE